MKILTQGYPSEQDIENDRGSKVPNPQALDSISMMQVLEDSKREANHEEAEENEEGGELVSSHCLKNTHDNYSDGFSNHKACKDGSGVLDTLHDVFFIVESHIVLAIFS